MFQPAASTDQELAAAQDAPFAGEAAEAALAQVHWAADCLKNDASQELPVDPEAAPAKAEPPAAVQPPAEELAAAQLLAAAPAGQEVAPDPEAARLSGQEQDFAAVVAAQAAAPAIVPGRMRARKLSTRPPA
jgi:hypothetical protein